MLYKISCGDRRFSFAVAKRIERATEGILEARLMMDASEDIYEDETRNAKEMENDE